MYKLKWITVALTTCATLNVCIADERGNATEAKALLSKSTAHYKAVGRDAALKDFSEKQGQFIDRDLYVFCYGPDAKISAHGFNQALIGKDISIFKDADGSQFSTKQNELTRASGASEVEYRWVSPVSKKIELKTAFAELVGQDVCGVGFYK